MMSKFCYLLLFVVATTNSQEGCGIRNKDGLGLKTNGIISAEAEFGEFPWMVAVNELEPTENNGFLNLYKCGGSLITPSVILTAAHCVADIPANKLKIRAGDWDVQTKNEIFPHQDRLVKEKIVHENYNKINFNHNIALLFVSEPFKIGDNVQIVCLPPNDMTFDQAKCFAPSWRTQEKKYESILQKNPRQILANSECHKKFIETANRPKITINDLFICAINEVGKKSCSGDNGSPLVCPIPNTTDKYTQAGILVWGIGCDDVIPGIYESVTALRSWIDEVLTKKDISTEPFTFKP